MGDEDKASTVRSRIIFALQIGLFLFIVFYSVYIFWKPGTPFSSSCKFRDRMGQRRSGPNPQRDTCDHPEAVGGDAPYIRQGRSVRIPLKWRREHDMSILTDYDVSTDTLLDDHVKQGISNPMVEDTPFRLLAYKRNRVIPVKFQTVDPSCSFWRVNPNFVAKDVLQGTHGKILSHRVARDGNVVINVASEGSANGLLLLETIAGVVVEAHIPDSHFRGMGRWVQQR